MMTVIIFLIVLSVLVLGHELGHFLMAKRFGMRVDEFGLGFPPRLFGVKRGETLYSLNLIPLGGFVKIHGENGDVTDDEEKSFASFSRGRRFLVLVAGVVMNLVLAVVLLTIGYTLGLPTDIGSGVPRNAHVQDAHVEITYVLPGSPAEEAGLTFGDRLLSVDGASVIDAEGAIALVGAVPDGVPVTLHVERDGATRDVVVAPELLEGDRVAVGMRLATVGIVRLPVLLAAVRGVDATVWLTGATAKGFAQLIPALFTDSNALEAVSGPVGIARMTGTFYQNGIPDLLQFAAILSINLAILNILPIPALDGGRILFLVVEAIRRRPVTPQIEGYVHAAGFALLMILVVLVTYKDIVDLVR